MLTQIEKVSRTKDLRCNEIINTNINDIGRKNKDDICLKVIKGQHSNRFCKQELI